MNKLRINFYEKKFKIFSLFVIHLRLQITGNSTTTFPSFAYIWYIQFKLHQIYEITAKLFHK